MSLVRFLIVAFDGLRQDMATPSLMPNLERFRSMATTFANHRASFPSDTRTNVLALVSGAHPGRHGMLGNRFVDRLAVPRRIIDTADTISIEAMERDTGGRFVEIETLGERLSRQGRMFVAIGAASAGSTRLLHHKVRSSPGHLCLSCHSAAASLPAAVRDEIASRFGPPPPVAIPDRAAMTYGTDIFLGYVWPRLRPDAAILWFNEPDASYHTHGIGSPASIAAIKAADAEFGRILDWWLCEGRDAGVQLLAMSDHGHVSTGKRLDVARQFAEAGFNAAAGVEDDPDLLVLPGAIGQIYVRNGDRALAAQAAGFLMVQDWCGLTFSDARNEVEGQVAGTFAKDLVFASHPRSADLIFTCRSDDAANTFGFRGRSDYCAPSAYASMHGGLHPFEMASVAILGGRLFREGYAHRCHSGIVDLLPTMLAAWSEPPAIEAHGRILHEAFEPAGPQAESREVRLQTGAGRYCQTLRRVRVGESVYADSGWNGPAAGLDG